MKKLVFISLLQVSGCLFTQDSVSVEMTVARAFIDAFNEEDSTGLREFTLNYRTEEALARRPIEERLEIYQTLQDKLGELEEGPISKSEPGNLKLYVYSLGKDSWFKFGFRLNEDGLLETLAIMPSRGPGKSKSGESLEDQVRQLVRDGATPGVAVLVIRQGKGKEVVVSGIRNKDTDEPVRRGDAFHLGSLSKSFTACMIGKLVDEGKLSLNDQLSEVLPSASHHHYSILRIRRR